MPFDPGMIDEWNENSWIELEAEKISRHEVQMRFNRSRPNVGLRSLRRKYKLSQVEMANVMRVSRRTYIDYEHGEKAIPSTALSWLQAEFECDLNIIFSGKQHPLTEQKGEELVSMSIDLVLEILNRYKGIGPDGARSVAGAMVSEARSPDALIMLDTNEFVSAYSDFFSQEQSVDQA